MPARLVDSTGEIRGGGLMTIWRAMVVSVTWLPAAMLVLGGDVDGAGRWLWMTILLRLVIIGMCSEVMSLLVALFGEDALREAEDDEDVAS